MTARKLLGTFFMAGALATPAWAETTLLGTGAIAGTATDGSGLTNLLEDGVTPNNLIGGLGSGIAYTGQGSLYLAVPDRGPADGTTTYTDRAYVVDLRVHRTVAGSYVVEPHVVATRILRTKNGTPFTGSAAAFDPTGSPDSLRFDPEGIRLGPCGNRFFVSDEYGPFLYEFGASGKRERVLKLPTKFLADLPSANPAEELANNAAGRQANRGMEGLAISPDGKKLYGILQSALIQDGGLDAALARVGVNNRILEVDVETGAVREFLYTLENRSYGVSEILSVNDHELLVLERDGRAGANAAFKKIFKIDIEGASDIRALAQLPETGVPAGITPVDKSLFLDLLAPAYGLAGASAPEKFEGLAFGPDLADGRHLLVVTTDNDFVASRPSLFYAFAVDPADLPGFEPQALAHGACRPPAN